MSGLVAGTQIRSVRDAVCCRLDSQDVIGCDGRSQGGALNAPRPPCCRPLRQEHRCTSHSAMATPVIVLCRRNLGGRLVDRRRGAPWSAPRPWRADDPLCAPCTSDVERRNGLPKHRRSAPRAELTKFSHVSRSLPDAHLESLANLAVNKYVLAHSLQW